MTHDTYYIHTQYGPLQNEVKFIMHFHDFTKNQIILVHYYKNFVQCLQQIFNCWVKKLGHLKFCTFSDVIILELELTPER